MNQTLHHICSFLKENRQHNDELQRYELQKAMFGAFNTREYTLSLLYHAFNTQSQPKLDKSLAFFKAVVSKGAFDTMQRFVQSLYKIVDKPMPKTVNYETLYNALKLQAGWRPKTAALFTKNIFCVHTKWEGKLGFWEDAPEYIAENDKLYLPVDEVILAIFREIAPSLTWNFAEINKHLQAEYKGAEMEVWDDLWFWGFIGQKGSGKNRTHQYNEAKLWSLQLVTSDKEKSHSLLQEKSEEFIALVSSKNLSI